MDGNRCEFCGSVYEFYQNLLAHQKTSKRCLEQQGEYGDDYTCEDCQKSFLTDAKLIKHHETCKLRSTRILYEDKIANLEADNENLRAKLKAKMKVLKDARSDLVELKFAIDYLFEHHETQNLEESIRILNTICSRHLFFNNKTNTATE